MTLLRYPGGKTRAITQLVQFIPKQVTEICSPFFGGGSFEMYLARGGVTVYGYDVFLPLVAFWEHAINNGEKLANEVLKYYPLSNLQFKELRGSLPSLSPDIAMAACYYAINRASYSGSTCSGGMSPGHPRFNDASVDRLRKFNMRNVSVECADFEESIMRHKNTFLFLDPPYDVASKLYGHMGSAHLGFDHERLHGLIKERSDWILCYNDSPRIRSLYSGHKIIELDWSYGMTHKKSSEIIILPKEVA